MEYLLLLTLSSFIFCLLQNISGCNDTTHIRDCEFFPSQLRPIENIITEASSQ